MPTYKKKKRKGLLTSFLYLMLTTAVSAVPYEAKRTPVFSQKRQSFLTSTVDYPKILVFFYDSSHQIKRDASYLKRRDLSQKLNLFAHFKHL